MRDRDHRPPGHCRSGWSVTYRGAGDQPDDPARAPGPDRTRRGAPGPAGRRPRRGRPGHDRRHPARLAPRRRGGRRRRPLVRARAVGPARAPRASGPPPRSGSTWRRPGRPSTRSRWSPSGSPTLPGVPVVGWGHRSGTWDRDVTVSELDAVTGDTPVVLISGDGHHAWLNTTALMHLAMPVRDSVVRETEWFARLPAAGHPGRQRRHLARGVPAHPRRGRGPRRRRAWSTSSSAAAARTGPSGGPRAATCCGSAGRRTPTRSTR